MLISTSYNLKWRHKDFHNYQWAETKELFNAKTGRKIKKTICGGSIGYCIKGKFVSLKSLKDKIELIPEEYNPF